MADDTETIRLGARVTWAAGKLDGHVWKIDGNSVHVAFDNGSKQTFSRDAGVVVPIPFQVGDQVQRPDTTVGVVVESISAEEYPSCRVAWSDGSESVSAEMTLRPAILGDPVERLRAGQLGRARDFNLRSVAADLWYHHLHDELVSLSHARVDLKPHQVSVVHRVVSNYPHRFLLCDEVGLGKTIEAAMIVKELRARGQAQRVLILVPAGLTRQWQFELKTKFNETFAIFDKTTLHFLQSEGADNPWLNHNSVIVSQSWAAASEERRADIAAVDWDLVIVDEAHHARRQRIGNTTRQTQLFRLVSALTSRPEFGRRAVLFLTATPLQLQHHEMFSLVEMLSPALFASEEEFVHHLEQRAGLSRLVERLQAGTVAPGAELEEWAREAAAVLDDAWETVLAAATDDRGNLIERLQAHHRLSEVLIRNRRIVIGGFMPRRAYRWAVEPTEAELAVQDLVDELISEGYREAEETDNSRRRNNISFLMVIWQKLAASSSRALAVSLRRRIERLTGGVTVPVEPLADAEDQLAADEESAEVTSRVPPAIADEVQQLHRVIAALDEIELDSKAAKLVEELQDLFVEHPEEKVLVFTEFRETQAVLAELLAAKGWDCHTFHGQLDSLQKDRAVQAFRLGSGPQVLVSTEAGGEGRNFQFAHILVNYDLPWNPMRVEQRIGRVDRIGQEQPVQVFNFQVRGTIEERILEVLENRIGLFEQSVGGLDPILGDAESDIRRALSRSAGDREAALEAVGRDLEERVEAAKKAESQLQDFILDARSFSAEIARTAQQRKAPVSNEEFERLLINLLRSVNTWVEPVDEPGEQRIQFHPPFSEDHKELVGDLEKRRVCFDPSVAVDSEYVEYFGFGHPIVDAIVRGVVEERHDGAAAIRRVSRQRLPKVRPGWQFNWLMKVGGVERNESLIPMFVGDDETTVDLELGKQLLALSRRFEREESDTVDPPEGLDAAYTIATRTAVVHRDRLITSRREQMERRYGVEKDRLERLYANRTRAAEDRVDRCEATLARLRSSVDRAQRQAIPLWDANLKRAERECEDVGADRATALRELDRRRNPDAEFRLLGVARIETAPVA